MSVLSAQSIRRRCTVPTTNVLAPAMLVERERVARRDFWPMIEPFSEREVNAATGMSAGLTSSGYDVRIDDQLRRLPRARGKSAGDSLALPRYDDSTLMLPPRCMVLASTVECFNLPLDLQMRVLDKSSWVRRGLTVQNTKAEPGWRGHLTLELVNHGHEPLMIPVGCPIAQVEFELLDQPTEQPYPALGKYQDQPRGPQPSKREVTT